jgi:flagellar motor switch protein FliN/FliY
MELTDNFDLDAMLGDNDAAEAANPVRTAAQAAPARDKLQLLRRIPVTLTLEVGAASVSLLELMAIEPGSVVELDRLAGEPLVIKANGTPVGLAEVVVAGENYGLKVVELNALDLDALSA